MKEITFLLWINKLYNILKYIRPILKPGGLFYIRRKTLASFCGAFYKIYMILGTRALDFIRNNFTISGWFNL